MPQNPDIPRLTKPFPHCHNHHNHEPSTDKVDEFAARYLREHPYPQA